jgi:hypothetical protein
MSGGQPDGGPDRAVALTAAVEGEFASEARVVFYIQLHERFLLLC